jgi:ribonucleoside-diphosphate reductase alpha chain
MSKTYGPLTIEADLVHKDKYRQRGESFRDAMTRIASTLGDTDKHFQAFRDILLEGRFMPGGRIQAAMGSTRITTPYNCFVSGTIEDTFTHGHSSIMARATDAANTMRLGGGIGYDFSTLRPRGELIKTLQSISSGAVSFMDIFDAVGLATASSGHRRGAQMGVLRVDHPDIEEFIRAKQNPHRLTGFNISVAITNEFMDAVKYGLGFNLRFGKKVYREIDARTLWDAIMRSTYDWSEPGVLFIDTINNMNNLYYCETISATNPCGEQPLPPYGACLLGSFNLVKYLERSSRDAEWSFNYKLLFSDIPHVVRGMDNVVDRARYPLHEQEKEAHSKRRMGLGITGLANTIEALGYEYASQGFLTTMSSILGGMKNATYRASAILAKEKGSFPLFDKEAYLSGGFISNLSHETRALIEANGIRNSHLLSIAPTGTISLAADNVSSGIEPVFALKVSRTIQDATGPRITEIHDYGARFLETSGKTSSECTAADHLAVLAEASRHVDSAVSKTCNVPNDIPWDDFKELYRRAHEMGCKGITTHRDGNLKGSIMVESKSNEEPFTISDPIPLTDASCERDPVTGRISCE